MGKLCHDDIIDGALNVLKNNANLMIACKAQPTTRTEAVATYALADITMAVGDFTVAPGDVSGRKVTVGAKSGVAVDVSDTATHIALVDATRLMYVTVCESQALTYGNTCDFPVWDIEIRAPS